MPLPATPSSLLEPVWVEFAALLPERGEFHPGHPLGCHRRRIPNRVVFEHVGSARRSFSSASTEHLAHGLGADELTLIIAPLATELPEKLNSVAWVRQGKDTLALGNITGAMAFQSMPLVTFGMVFTGWRLTAPALLAMLAALGGAAFSLITVRHPAGWPVPFIGCWAGLYLGGVASIIAIA